VSDGGEAKVRRYRYSEPRRAGLFGTLALSMLVPLTVALVAAWLAIAGLLVWPLAVPVVAGGGWLSFGRIRGRPAHEVLPAVVGFWWWWLRHRHRWLRPVPLITDGEIPVALPPPLAGLALFETDVTWMAPGRPVSMAVIHDRGARTVTAVLAVSGDGQFSLLDGESQDLRLDGWGSALGGFARERGDVVRVAWKDWAAPVPLADQVGRLQTRWADEPTSPARESYLALMEVVAPNVTEHELLVEVTVAAGRRRRPGGGLGGAVAALSEELALFKARLEAAGLQVSGVLSAAEAVAATRVRSDPTALEQLATLRQSLAATVGAAAPTFGPFHVAENLVSVAVDRSLHRSWWFARWPRRDVPGGWLDKLIFDCGCTRTVTVVFEPIPPSRSDHAVDRELVRREANIESRQRRGFRVTGKDRKALAEAERREDELNAGFPELCYVGLVTVTAPDADTLESESSRVEQTAAQVGIELQPLLGQQAAGWVASLPLGRTVAQRLTSP
jgi:hypothetical protein